MRYGINIKYKFGDVILVEVPFTDTKEFKLRPAFVLFEEFQNIVIIGITSNTKMKGIFVPKEEGLVVDSVIKLNYIFTISKERIKKKLCSLSQKIKNKVCEQLKERIDCFKSEN